MATGRHLCFASFTRRSSIKLICSRRYHLNPPKCWCGRTRARVQIRHRQSIPPTAQTNKQRSRLLSSGRDTFEWKITPNDEVSWLHAYLPIARLYEGPAPAQSTLFGAQNESEMDLEGRFASNLLSPWKDYTRRLSQALNQIQEEGLAQILRASTFPKRAVL